MHTSRRVQFLPPGLLCLVASFALTACTGGGAARTPPAAASAPPTASPGQTGPTTVATGTFHDVDGTASGTVALVHLPNGSFEIVFEDFSIGSAAHTNVALLPVKDVKSDNDVDKSAILDLGPLKGKTGMQDFPIPSSKDAMGYHTVVLWDTEMAHAIAAAPLQ
jgi:electron transfer DM13